MKLVVIGAVALPVVLGGFGIAAAAMFAPEPPPPGTGPGGSIVSDDGSSGLSDLGTSIDGRRPHLTVIDGSASIILPGSLAGIVSMLPRIVSTLSGDSPLLTGVLGPDPADAGSPTGNAEQPRQVSPAPRQYVPQAAPEPSSGPAYPAPTALSMPPAPTVPSVPVVTSVPVAPKPPPAPATDRDDQDTGYSDDRDDRDDWDAGDSVVSPPDARITDSGPPERTAPRGRTGPPPHASETGRPDHADTTGPPPHANRKARTDITSSPR